MPDTSFASMIRSIDSKVGTFDRSVMKLDMLTKSIFCIGLLPLIFRAAVPHRTFSADPSSAEFADSATPRAPK
eukprot:3813914-Karenia_brevis.AAC.1